ncbi:hypothetical protein RJ641_031891 [Dillenia turbinata]|uniref:Uncharacterized protein n=1 Tax=Dillenia turbinata TaxID=194707 RepID=A0AAN8W1T7_9MAGN
MMAISVHYKMLRQCIDFADYEDIYSCQGEDVSDLDVTTLEELQNLHVEAITKICQAKFCCLHNAVHELGLLACEDKCKTRLADI